MISQDKLSELNGFLQLFTTSKWVVNDRRIEDDTRKWIIYQAGFDSLSDQRLDFIATVMNLLPELVETCKAHLTLEGQEEPLNKASILKLIREEIAKNEAGK